jgi:long-chain acyl-CoA synthetase
MSVIGQIIQRAELTPDIVAIQDKDRTISFFRFQQDIINVANHLKLLQVKTGDNVILHANNSYAFICCYFSVHFLAARNVIVDPKAEVSSLEFIREKTQPRCELTSFEALLEPCSELFTGGNQANAELFADIIFTSGTTGEPKGVALTHQQVLDATIHIAENVGNDESDRELLLMPLCHSFALGRMRSALLAGTRLVIGYPLNRLKQVFKALELHQITGFGIVPAAWDFITLMSKEKIANYAPQLKYIELGSAVLSMEKKEHMRSLFPTTHLVMHYGLTEVSRAIFSRFHHDPDDAMGSISSGANVRILDPTGMFVKDGTEGEIALKSPWMLSAYLDLPELNQSVFADGYFKTGDLGVVENNYLYLRGRLKEIINVGGKKVNPSDIEKVLLQHSKIIDCACVAHIDPVVGEVVKAFIVIGDITKTGSELAATTLQDPLEAVQQALVQNIQSFVQDKLPNHMRPQYYSYVSTIPKTATGKIQRLKLVQKNN